MAILNSEQLIEFAGEKFGNRWFWIGATDSEVEGSWRWIDGSEMMLADWRDNEPNGEEHENCLYFWVDGWVDMRCNHLTSYLCERRHSAHRACTILP